MSGETELRNPDLGSLSAIPERKPLGHYVFENLKQAIVRGNFSPGNRLVESHIAEAMGISRTPVREAIHKLEREGLIKKLPQGGFYVLNLTREDIEETFGIRGVLESYAARLAAIKHKKEELAPLEEKIEEFQYFLNHGEMEALLKINTEFHGLLYAMSRSPKLIKMINDLQDQIYRFRRIILKIETMAQTSNEDHRHMLRAMRKRDADRVETLVRQHILRGQKIVLRELENRVQEF
ncbi:MAG: GntR family transcriptional regulator [Deltaproteobacteria bacterium]|nr:MAG: GntR family transcriptional regulator [Deltaproteobacteria bacterium]